MSASPYLSLVLTGRNDDYGGSFVSRFFRVLAFNLELLAERQLSTEVVLVEWCPSSGRPLLGERLRDALPARFREQVTTYVVDNRYQDAMSLNPQLEYLEFVAKNVGIRRATGQYLLTTNTDLILSAAMGRALASDTLQPRCVYRANRIDLKLGIDDSTLHHELLENPDNHVPRPPIAPPLYAGAAGDFTLLDQETFHQLRGFNEIYRMVRIGVDHNFLVKAQSSGVTIADIGPPIYHVAHLASYQTSKHIASQDQAHRRWGRVWHNHDVIYDNREDWGLRDAPIERLSDGIWKLGFDWRAVPPLVDLHRIVLPGMTPPNG
ncbi:MAG: hypothetical protein OSB03_00405 [Vicinamibacterales bacterium]|nr:hypothetical protein [Vicinamibacterales bacterium]